MLTITEAFSSFSVDDLQKAKEFYSETLGIGVAETPEGGLQLSFAHGGEVFIYPKPNHAPATFTVLNFSVPDIEKAVDKLAQKGIAMERYDMPGMPMDEKGIVHSERSGPRAIAWFKDPAGNVLSVVQEQ